MTRINLVPPAELCDQHLIAEWRELTRIPNGIVSGKYKVDLKEIPKQYTVRTNDNPAGGKGHMKFFFDKLYFLFKRYEAIRAELEQRGMPRKSMWPDTDAYASHRLLWGILWSDYKPTPQAIMLNRKRIRETFPNKPRYAKERL